MERIGPSRSRIKVPQHSPGPAPGAAVGILRPAEPGQTEIVEVAAPSPSPVPAPEARASGKRSEPAVKGGPETSSPRASVSPEGAPFLGTKK